MILPVQKCIGAGPCSDGGPGAVTVEVVRRQSGDTRKRGRPEHRGVGHLLRRDKVGIGEDVGIKLSFS